jgi:hypothetical protein
MSLTSMKLVRPLPAGHDDLALIPDLRDVRRAQVLHEEPGSQERRRHAERAEQILDLAVRDDAVLVGPWIYRKTTCFTSVRATASRNGRLDRSTSERRRPHEEDAVHPRERRGERRAARSRDLAAGRRGSRCSPRRGGEPPRSRRSRWCP